MWGVLLLSLCVSIAVADKLWTALPIDNAPSARFDYSYGYNPATSNLFVFGGTQADFSKAGDFFSYNIDTNTWTSLSTLNGPSARQDAGGAFCNGEFWVVAGNTDGVVYSDVFAYSEVTLSWRSLNDFMLISGGSLVCAPKNGVDTLFYFGGLLANGDYSDALYIYDIASSTWSVGAVGPAARQWSPMAVATDFGKIVLFAGWPGSQPQQEDLWYYNINENTWENVPKQGDWPVGRSGHAFAYDATVQSAFLFGGENNDGVTGMNDLWYLDLNTNTWTQFTAQNTPTGRLGEGAVVTNNNEIIIFGGVTGWTENDGVVGDMWRLSAAPECRVDIVLVANGHWTQSGATYTQYSVSVFNAGSQTVYELPFSLNLGDLVVTQAWNLQQTGTSFGATNFYLLHSGEGFTGAGFIAVGLDVPTVQSSSPTCISESASVSTTCGDVSVTATLRPGTVFIQNGELHSQYDLSVVNGGSGSVSAVSVDIISTDASHVETSWNLNLVSSNSYSVDFFGNTLESGQGYASTHGFIWTGSGTFELACSAN